MNNKTPEQINESKPPPPEGTARNQHDAFFKDILANIDHARILIKAILPKHIASIFNWNGLEPPKDTFITPEGRELRADAVFKLPFKEAGKDDYVYLLLEHKSSQQPGINMQLTSTITKQAPILLFPSFFTTARQHGRSQGRWVPPRYQSTTKK